MGGACTGHVVYTFWWGTAPQVVYTRYTLSPFQVMRNILIKIYKIN